MSGTALPSRRGLGGRGGGIGRLRLLERPPQALARRVRRVLPPGAPAGIAFAGQQHFRKALRPAQRIAAFEEAHDGRRIELTAAVHVAMLARHHVGQFTAGQRHAPTVAHSAQQLGAALLVADVTRPLVGRCGALAQVVAEASKAHRQRRGELRAHVEHHHQVHAGVDLGVVLARLRHAPEPIDLGQQPRKRTTAPQHLEHAARARLHQSPRELLPDAFGHQRIHLAGLDHLAHQRLGLVRDAEVGEARRQPRQAEDAHRVFGEGR